MQNTNAADARIHARDRALSRLNQMTAGIAFAAVAGGCIFGNVTALTISGVAPSSSSCSSLTAVVDPFTHLGWLAAVVPFSSYYRTLWLGLGTIAFELLVAIVVTSLLRNVIGQAAWRLIHWLAYASWPVAVIHGFGTGTDALSAWFVALSIVCVVSVTIAIVYRLLHPPADPLTSARSEFRSGVSRKPDQ